MKTLTAVALLLLLGGCTSTKSGVDKTYDIRLTNGDGVIVLTINLDADTATDTTSGDAAATTSPRTALGYQGGTAAIAEEGAEMALDGIKSIYEAWQDRRDNRVDNTQTNVPVVTPPVVTPVVPSVEPVTSVTMPFHHTQTDPDCAKDCGKALTMCPDVNWQFEKVWVQVGFNEVKLPFHGRDEGRIHYWNADAAPAGDILATKDGKQYSFPAGELLTFGDCP